MSDRNTSRGGGGGVGTTGVLFLIFLVLKLTGHIDWSWWWVTSPLWIGICVWLVVFSVIWFGMTLIDKTEKRAPPRWDEVDEPFVKPPREGT